MTISMQVRRALITLGLATTAIVFVAAKTSMGAAVHMQTPLTESIHAETVLVARETFQSPPAAASVRVISPMVATKERAVRKMARIRCESVSRG